MADAAIALVSGAMDDKSANALKGICKEIRDNADLQFYLREIRAINRLSVNMLKRLESGGKITEASVKHIIDSIMVSGFEGDGTDDDPEPE